MYFSCVYIFKIYLAPLECKVHEGRDFYMFGSLPSLLEQCLSGVSVQYLGVFVCLNTYSFIYLAASRIFIAARGILVLLPETEPMPSALDGGPPGKSTPSFPLPPPVVACELLVAGSLLCHVGSSSLTRSGIWAPCIGSAES